MFRIIFIILYQFVKILGRLVRTNLTLIAKLSRYDGPGMGLQGMKTIHRKLEVEESIYSRLKRLSDIVYLFICHYVFFHFIIDVLEVGKFLCLMTL